MKAWAIRRKSDGLYSTASSVPFFKKNGKMFYRYSDLTRHISFFSRYASKKADYKDCEIVEFDLVESKITDISVEMNLADF